MAASAHNAYLEEKILSADPVELVRMLYRAAIESVEAARGHRAAQRIAQRSCAISKAVEILMELNASLNHERAPEVSRRLGDLYDYMERRLLEANYEQVDAPLAEVLKLLETLAAAWKMVPPCSRPANCQAAPEASWPAPVAEPEPAVHGWSF